MFDGTLDNIVGMVHAKDLLRVLRYRPATFTVRDVMREVHVIPGSREVEEVLADFKRLKEHMAVVLDEYGGTAGVVTMEDLLEEIVGEILDEYDEGPSSCSARRRRGDAGGRGDEVGDVNEQHGLQVPEDSYTTVGGYVFGALGRLPEVGDRVRGGGATFMVRAMDGRRIETLALERR